MGIGDFLAGILVPAVWSNRVIAFTGLEEGEEGLDFLPAWEEEAATGVDVNDE